MQVNLEIKDSTYKECKKYAKKFGVDLETFLVSMLEKSFPPISNSKIKEKKLQELQKVMDRVAEAFIYLGGTLAEQGRYKEAHAIFEKLEQELSAHLKSVQEPILNP
ncbi:hypothetical protein [Helicobacter suis]|nr:hypothetical protein [Helicobacter suis]BCD50619.1 hypothetical protein NHP194022_02900 [Helicobacter suis]BCD69644.1 hypothetical protein SNTW_02890 [Helicobacter suis]GFK16124.1 hypothetical protein NHP190033_03000 [Helicobacter suis]